MLYGPETVSFSVLPFCKVSLSLEAHLRLKSLYSPEDVIWTVSVFHCLVDFRKTRRLFHYTIWWHFILAPKCGVFLTSFHVLITAILWGPVWIFQETGSVLLWWGDVGSQTQGWGVCPCLGKSLEPTCSLKPNGRLEQWVRLLHLESDHQASNSCSACTSSVTLGKLSNSFFSLVKWGQ